MRIIKIKGRCVPRVSILKSECPDGRRVKDIGEDIGLLRAWKCEGKMKGNMKIEKIKKSSSIALKVTNIIKIICAVCAGITIIAGCIMIGLKGVVNDGFAVAMENGLFTEDDLNLSYIDYNGIVGHLVEDGYIAETIGVYIISAGFTLVFMTIVLHFVSRVFKSFMESYSPFQPGILKNLKIAFVLITIAALTSSIGIGLIIGFAAWCVLNIFEYGCELQKLSDETL